MSKNPELKQKHDDEIDLLDLIKKIGQGFARVIKAIGRGILFSAVFFVRNWLPLSLSVVIGLILAYFIKIGTPSFYTSDMTLKTNVASSAEMIEYINRLHTFCKERNIIGLADAISLEEDQAKNIKDISAFWIIDQGTDGIPDFVDYYDKNDVYDTINTRMQGRLNVRVRLKLPQELNKVSDGLIKFIQSDSLFQQKNRIRLRHTEELLSRFSYDIVQLDSLQKVKYFEETRNMQPKNGGQMIFLQEHNTQLVYEDIYTLYTRKQALESERDIYKDITTILSNFSIPTRRINGGTYYALRTVPILFGVTLILLIILANKKKLIEIFKKY